MLICYAIYFHFLTVLAFTQTDIYPDHILKQSDTLEADYYTSGLQQLEEGDWKGALNTWLKAKTNASEQNPDPRIGFAFIEVVTQQKAEQYYELANTMYFWGLEAGDIQSFKNDLYEEMMRLKPIMSDSLFTDLRGSLKHNDPGFMALLRQFWIKQDPFPSSGYNERLIEHWSRIAYARAHFTRAANTIYETDDRGIVYVRFGKPFEVKKRNVSLNRLIDPVTGARIDLFNNISFDLEIWYYLLKNDEELTSFTFGRPGTGGAYGLQPGILSMVPVAGNRISSYYDEQKSVISASRQLSNSPANTGDQQNTSNALPGYTPVSRDGAELMIKYAVLEDIGAIDPFYNELYNQMTRDIIRAELSGAGEKFSRSALTNLPKYNSKELSASLLQQRLLPAGLSQTKAAVEHLSLASSFYRFLDQNYEPVYMLVTEAIDFTPIFLHLEKDNNIDIYQINTLSVYDEQWRLRNRQPHILPLNNEGHFGKGIYYFGASSSASRILLEAQFVDKKAAKDADRIHREFGAKILASTHLRELVFPDKLVLDSELNIQLSDIILGYAQEAEPQNRIPFTPHITSTFKVGQEILVYFEVYNLPEGRPYRMEYFFEKHDGKKKVKVKDKGSVIINYVSASGLEKEWFNASLSDLKKESTYDLVLKLTLPDAAKSITRRVTFSTVD